MKFEEIAKNIFHVNFPNQLELTSTFLRFQEHFESPYFRGKVFSLEEFKSWYVRNSPKGRETGEFTYYSDWLGFNIPSNMLEPFYQGKFNPLSAREKRLLDLFRKKRGSIFYIIGTSGASNHTTLKHEIAHGLFYTNPEYKKEVLKILDDIDSNDRKSMKSYLSGRGGYHPSVFVDETHANILSNIQRLRKRGLDVTNLKPISRRLNQVFRRYYP